MHAWASTHSHPFPVYGKTTTSLLFLCSVSIQGWGPLKYMASHKTTELGRMKWTITPANVLSIHGIKRLYNGVSFESEKIFKRLLRTRGRGRSRKIDKGGGGDTQQHIFVFCITNFFWNQLFSTGACLACCFWGSAKLLANIVMKLTLP